MDPHEREFAVLIGWRDAELSGHEGVVESRTIRTLAPSDRIAILRALDSASAIRRDALLSASAEIASVAILTPSEEAEIAGSGAV